jgi:NAD(P)-dependent dehydrogenase (short-subunit alcohol dehydrogenase family)
MMPDSALGRRTEARASGARLAGRVAIVTGGASGIGKGIVERLVADGALVCIADLALAPAEALADALGVSTIAREVDVADEASVDRLVAATVARFGSLDIMVNNAGTIAISPLTETGIEDWRRVFRINVEGVFLCCRAAARQMIAQGRGGTIVNAASGAGRRGGMYVSHYSASKAAVILMTQSLALELARHRIRANCYAPGHIETPMWREIATRIGALDGRPPERVVVDVAASVPWGRFGTPAEVAATVSFLASDDAEYISGQTIAMNGAELFL